MAIEKSAPLASSIVCCWPSGCEVPRSGNIGFLLLIRKFRKSNSRVSMGTNKFFREIVRICKESTSATRGDKSKDEQKRWSEEKEVTVPT
jgi:hypothetical protein